MKKLYIALSLFLASFAYSQVPQAFSYQTIAFNSAGAPIANGNVNLRISILDNSATGTVLYTETHTKTTNSKGLVNLNIGQGTATTGNFGGINWGTNSKFVKVEMDPVGGSNYMNVGVNQLMSVPYALVAGKVDLTSPNSTIGDDFIENKSTNYLFIDKFNSKINVLNSKTGSWSSQNYNIAYYNNGITPNINTSNGNFIFIDKFDRKLYIFNSQTGSWSSQNYNIAYYNNGITPTVDSSNGNTMFIDKFDSKVYIFNAKSGIWSSQNYNISYYNNGIVPNIVLSNFNFMFIDKFDRKVNVFNSKTGTWSSQNYNIGYYNNGIVPTVNSSNGNFIFIDKFDSKVYTYNSKTGSWNFQNYDIGYYNNGIVPTIISSDTN